MESARKESRLKSRLNLILCLAACTLGVSAQARSQARPEVRADAIVTRETALYAGIGVLVPAGTYVRSGVVGAAGVVNGEATFRADIVSIFHTDPFRESRWGPYGGGGVSLRHDSGENGSNAFLMAFLGVEGPPRNGFATAFELGLGGGVRAGVILRRAGGRTR